MCGQWTSLLRPEAPREEALRRAREVVTVRRAGAFGEASGAKGAFAGNTRFGRGGGLNGSGRFTEKGPFGRKERSAANGQFSGKERVKGKPRRRLSPGPQARPRSPESVDERLRHVLVCFQEMEREALVGERLHERRLEREIQIQIRERVGLSTRAQRQRAKEAPGLKTNAV